MVVLVVVVVVAAINSVILASRALASATLIGTGVVGLVVVVTGVSLSFSVLAVGQKAGAVADSADPLSFTLPGLLACGMLAAIISFHFCLSCAAAIISSRVRWTGTSM